MDVLRKINKMRLDRNWSIYRLSVESGISQSTLTNMFNRETLPSISTLECICNAFGITMAEFFTEGTSVCRDYSECELVQLFNKLNDEGKMGLISLLRNLTSE